MELKGPPLEHYTVSARAGKNPFNGIESHTRRAWHSDIEVRQNPFNGIERRVYCFRGCHVMPLRIHSMELKEPPQTHIVLLQEGVNPFNGIERAFEE